MIESAAERTIIRYLSVGVPLASAFVWASGTTDPVNVTKLFITGGVGFAAGLTALAFFWKRLWTDYKVQMFSVIFFQLAMINSLFLGEGPFLQSYYGTYGRQTGFITYFVLSLVLVATMAVRDKALHLRIIKGFLFVGILNILYCAWVLMFGDFLPWNNIYRSILGLFGNPDFISAFLGMFIVACVSIFVRSSTNIKVRVLLFTSSLVAFYEILESKAIQGIVVTVGGTVLVGFFWLRSKCSTWSLPAIYASLSSFVGLVGILGTLQIGPLSFIYKRSVSLRGSYWHAGLGMGDKYPVSGVGLDGYGDFYRQTRPPVALQDMPGIKVVSNVSHNVLIDFFAFGGWPLLIAYAILNILVGIEIVRHIVKVQKYDYVFVALSSTWICYTVQSIISINQIGLAIWGWILAGALLSYKNLGSNSKFAENNKPTKQIKKTVTSAKGSVFTPQLIAGLACALGLFLSFPPLGSDMKWKSALESRNLAQLEASLSDSFINPVPSSRYMMAYQIFGNSNLPDKALEYTRKIVNSNPNFYEGWRALYLLNNSTQAEKNLAIVNLRRLDPLNPDVLSPNS